MGEPKNPKVRLICMCEGECGKPHGEPLFNAGARLCSNPKGVFRSTNLCRSCMMRLKADKYKEINAAIREGKRVAQAEEVQIQASKHQLGLFPVVETNPID